MNPDADPYARLATLLWLLKPEDVCQLAGLAEKLADARLASFVGGGDTAPSQSPPSPQLDTEAGY